MKASDKVSSDRRPKLPPLAKVKHAVRAAATVAPDDTLLGVPAGDFTPEAQSAVDRLQRRLRRLEARLDKAARRVSYLEALADRDALTSLLNRRAFLRELSRMMAFAERYKTPSSVIYFDVNGMKQINDSLGHAAGDATLRHIAGVLAGHVRASDVVGRLGGDEFAVLLAHLGGSEALAKAGDLALAVARRPVLWQRTSLQLRVAYGVHSFSGEEPLDAALHAADQAMYAQKNGDARAAGN